MSDISSAGSHVTTQNAFRDSSYDTASGSPLHSNADSPDLTTGEKLSRDTTTAEQLKSAQSPLDNLLSDAGEMVDDATDTVADMATDAYEGLQTLNQEYALAQRGMGALKTLGGVGEAFIGSVGIVAPEPATTVGGAILFAHGADVAWSGLQEVWYGEPVETLTDQAVTEGAKLLGADELTAKSLGDGADIGLSLGSAGVGAYQTLTRPVVTQLEPIIVRPQTKPVSENGLKSSTAASIKPTVTAEAHVNGSVFKDVNQTARVGSKIDQPTLIAERIAEKTTQTGKALPNGNMATAHAEVGAIQKAFDAGVTSGSDMTLTVTGKAVCGFCRGDVAAMAEKANLKSLTVYEETTGNTLYWQTGMKSLKKVN